MPHLFLPAVFLESEKTFLVHVCYSQCISASCFEFHEMFYQKRKKLSLKQFLFSSHYMNETTLMPGKFSALYSLIPLTNHYMFCIFHILFAVFNNLSDLYFGYRFLLDFCMLELLISSGLHTAGRSYSQCYLRSANHSRESKSDLNVQMEKHCSEA